MKNISKTILFAILITAMILPFSSMDMSEAAAERPAAYPDEQKPYSTDFSHQLKKITDLEKQITSTKNNVLELQKIISQLEQNKSKVQDKIDKNNTPDTNKRQLQNALKQLDTKLDQSNIHVDSLDAKLSALYDKFHDLIRYQFETLSKEMLEIQIKEDQIENDIKEKQSLAANDKARSSQILKIQIKTLQVMQDTLDAKHDKIGDHLEKINQSSINSMKLDPQLEKQLDTAAQKLSDVIVSELEQNPNQKLFLGLPIQSVYINYMKGNLAISLDKTQKHTSPTMDSLGLTQKSMAFTDLLSNLNSKASSTTKSKSITNPQGIAKDAISSVLAHIPFQISYEDPIQQQSCNSRDDYCRPLIGGLEITDKIGNQCTLGFPATNKNGDKGFVTAGHCFPELTDVYQGTDWFGKSKVGVVSNNTYNPSEPVKCDCAFVKIDNDSITTQNKVYASSNWSYPIKDVSSDSLKAGQPFVIISGAITNDIEIGLVTSNAYNLKSEDAFYKTVFPTTYLSQTGDSGAPIFIYDPDERGFVVVGMHVVVGLESGFGYFEPWEDVEHYLGLR